jgi:hypothetical protein
MKVLMVLISILSVPLMILNMLGSIVSGIWLAILGDWWAIVQGIIFLFTSHFLLAFALMPSMLFALPAVYFLDKGKTFWLAVSVTLSSGYILALITVWCCWIFFLFMQNATGSDFIPRLIWSYGVAIGPWSYMASKDQGPESEGFAASLATFLAELAYITIMVVVLFTSITLYEAIKVFGSFMLVGLVIQVGVLVMVEHEKKQLAAQSALKA